MKEERICEQNDIEISSDPKLCHGVLENGFSYWIRPHSRPKNRVQLQLIFSVGSLQEEEDQRGLAHILEHMAFHGSKNFSKEDIESYFQSIGMKFGAHVNAQTGFQKTSYKFQVPTKEIDQLKKAFLIMRDWCSELDLLDEEIEKERRIGLEEYRQSLSGMRRTREQLLPTLFFEGRQVERLPIGTKESLENFSPDALRQFYCDWYSPKQASVIVVGDIDVEQVQTWIHELFSDWQPSSQKEKIAYPLSVTHPDLWVTARDEEVPFPLCAIVEKRRFSAIKRFSDFKERLLFSVVRDILNQRFDFISRRKDCPLQRVQFAKQELSIETDAFLAQAMLDQEAPKQGVLRFIQELRTIREFGVSQEELDIARKRILESSEMLCIEENNLPARYFLSGLQNCFLRQQKFLDFQTAYQLRERALSELDTAQINRYLSQLWRGTGFVFQYISPLEQQITEEELRKWVEEGKNLPLVAPEQEKETQPLLSRLPEPQKVLSEKYDEKHDIVEWSFENGAKIWLKQTNFQTKQIRFMAIGDGGYSVATDEAFLSAKAMLEIAHYSGAAGHSGEDLDRIMASPKGSASFGLRSKYHEISGYAFPEMMEQMWQYIWIRTQEADWSQEVLERVSVWYQNALMKQDNDPQRVFAKRKNELFWQNHFRKRYPELEDCQSWSLKQMKEVFENTFQAAANMTYMFVGPFNLDELRPIIERYIGGLPVAPRQGQKDVGIRIFQDDIQEKMFLEQEEKATVSLSLVNRGSFSREEKFSHYFLQNILQERLRKEIREDKGGSYHVAVQGQFQDEPESWFVLSINFDCEPERAEELKILVENALTELRENGVDLDEITVTRTQLEHQLEEDEKEDSYWISLFRLLAKNNWNLSDLKEPKEFIEVLSDQKINDMIHKLLKTDNVLEMLLLPKD